MIVQTGFGGYGVVVKKFAAGDDPVNPIFFSFIRVSRRFRHQVEEASGLTPCTSATCTTRRQDIGAFPVLLAAARLMEGPYVLPRTRAELALFTVLGLTGMFGGQLLYILGVYFAGASLVSMMQPAMPVWVSVFVVIVGVEPPPPIQKLWGWAKMIGIGLAAAGAVLMAVGQKKATAGAAHEQDPELGIILSLGNTLLFAIYVTIQKK